MNEAHLAARSPEHSPADPPGKTGLDPFVLREDLPRSSVPIDQFGSWRMHGLLFVLVVMLPIVCTAIYYGLIAAGKYSVEFRFSVRSAAELAADEDDIALMIKARKPGTQEIGRVPYMAADYLRSRNVVRELDRDGWLRSVFSRDQADWLSRFDPTKSDDDLWLYWREMISANVDRVSGLVLVRVLAFTPEDALALARAVSVSAEKMIDSVAMRERRDALFLAEQELERASLRHSAALTALRDVRNQEGTVDPEQTMKNSADTLLGVMREKLSLERDHDANLKVLSADAPQQKVLADQIRALGSQVASLTEALTSHRKNAKTAAQSIALFEQQELEVRFSKRVLEIAQAAYERARQESERQHVYFALFVEPKKPEIAEYPRRARLVAFAGICAFSLWSVMMLAAAGIRDHKIER
jgi:capsular polysaccharide transport system permease protein